MKIEPLIQICSALTAEAECEWVGGIDQLSTLRSGLSYFLAASFRPVTVNKCGTFVKPLIKTTEITLSEHRKPLRGAGFNIFFYHYNGRVARQLPKTSVWEVT